jgi:hypothetical protein
MLLFQLRVRNDNQQSTPVTLMAVCGPGDELELVITNMLPGGLTMLTLASPWLRLGSSLLIFVSIAVIDGAPADAEEKASGKPGLPIGHVALRGAVCRRAVRAASWSGTRKVRRSSERAMSSMRASGATIWMTPAPSRWHPTSSLIKILPYSLAFM